MTTKPYQYKAVPGPHWKYKPVRRHISTRPDPTEVPRHLEFKYEETVAIHKLNANDVVVDIYYVRDKNGLLVDMVFVYGKLDRRSLRRLMNSAHRIRGTAEGDDTTYNIVVSSGLLADYIGFMLRKEKLHPVMVDKIRKTKVLHNLSAVGRLSDFNWWDLDNMHEVDENEVGEEIKYSVSVSWQPS